MNKYIKPIVIIGPIKTRLNKAGPMFFKSLILKFNPPSNTITDTSKDTNGYNKSPNIKSVSNTPKIGPTKKPENSNII